jgi:methyl coenzyme M reductase subunit D
MRLEIEKRALAKEASGEAGGEGVVQAQGRVKEIDRSIAELREKTSELELRWKNEKETLDEIKQIKDDNSSYIFCNDQTQKQLDKSFKLIEEEINRSKS